MARTTFDPNQGRSRRRKSMPPDASQEAAVSDSAEAVPGAPRPEPSRKGRIEMLPKLRIVHKIDPLTWEPDNRRVLYELGIRNI